VLPFFKLLKHQEKFVWTSEADQALAQLKDFLSKPPVLTTPRKGEQLLLYLAATTHVVSTAIVVERQEDGHAYPVQRPVYFISEVLSEATVHSAHHLAEATTLLLGVLNLRRHRLPARLHPAEPRCYWKNIQVGS
jgi:dsDNA-binding SOS-regulon protein